MIEEIGEAPSEIYSTVNHANFRWTDGEREVFFSAARQGDAMTIHIAATGRNKLGLRDAVAEFVGYIFDNYQWCKVVMGGIIGQSVVNLALKCGFEYLAPAVVDGKQGSIVARFRT